MTRGVVRWVTAATVALAALLGVSSAVPAGARTPPARSAAEGTWIRITAFAVDPVESADVTVVSVKNGHFDKVLFSQRLKSGAGAFAAHVDHVPSAFRVVLSNVRVNGDSLDGELMADARHFNAKLDVVATNPVTTLVSTLRAKRRSMTLSEAQARVRRFLGLPSGSDLGVALREVAGFDSPYFSMTTFMSEARDHHGLRVFEAALVKDMLKSPKATRRFLPGHRFKSVGGFIARNLAAGVLSYAGGQGAGWVVSALGLSTTSGISAADIANLQQGLNDLQTSVANLSQQLDALDQEIKRSAHETQYATLTSQALVIAGTITATQDNLTQYANQCLELDSANQFVPQGADCTNQKDTVISELRDPAVNGAYDQLANLVLDSPVGTSGIVHLFGLSLAESRRFFRPADSVAVQQVSDFWDNELIQAGNLKTELLHLNGVQNSKTPNALTRLLGDPSVKPPLLGTFQTNRDAQAKLVYPAVPDGTVILTTAAPTMWATALPSWVPGPAPRNTSVSCPTLQFSKFYPTTPADPTGLNYGAVTTTRKFIPVDAPVSYLGLDGWTSPTTTDDGRHADFNTLISGWNGTSPNAWLTAQTKAEAPESPTSPGFFNIVNCSYPKWLPTDSQGYPYMQFPSVSSATGDSLDMSNGKVSLKAASWWIMLVRTLSSKEQYYPYS